MTALTHPFRQPDFRPTPWASGPHAQSILSSAQPKRWFTERAARPFVDAGQAMLVDCGAGVRLLGHYNAAPADGECEPNGRLVVIIHGWEGSSESIYNLSVGPALNAQGFDTLRLNLRDHGPSHHLNEEMFHSCRIDEVVGAFKWINREFPDRRVSAVGFSLGGNFALRVANRAPGEGIALDQVIAICPVLDPAETMQALDSGPLIYEKYFIRKWRRSLDKKRSAFPEIYSFRNLEKFTNLKQMTDYFVTRYTDYDDLHTYLDGYAITEGRLDNVDIPVTVLLAADDPVIPVQGVERMHFPPGAQVFVSPAGGHCGFMQGLTLRSYVDEFVLEHLQAGG